MGVGPVNSLKVYECACGCHTVSLYWNHKKGQITCPYHTRMVYLALEEIKLCLIKHGIKLLSCVINPVITHRLRIKSVGTKPE